MWAVKLTHEFNHYTNKSLSKEHMLLPASHPVLWGQDPLYMCVQFPFPSFVPHLYNQNGLFLPSHRAKLYSFLHWTTSGGQVRGRSWVSPPSLSSSLLFLAALSVTGSTLLLEDRSFAQIISTFPTPSSRCLSYKVSSSNIGVGVAPCNFLLLKLLLEPPHSGARISQHFNFSNSTKFSFDDSPEWWESQSQSHLGVSKHNFQNAKNAIFV